MPSALERAIANDDRRQGARLILRRAPTNFVALLPSGILRFELTVDPSNSSEARIDVFAEWMGIPQPRRKIEALLLAAPQPHGTLRLAKLNSPSSSFGDSDFGEELLSRYELALSLRILPAARRRRAAPVRDWYFPKTE